MSRHTLVHFDEIGRYISDEIGQSQAQKNVATINEVVNEVKYPSKPKDESVKNDFQITFGKFNGKRLSEIPRPEAVGYLDYLIRAIVDLVEHSCIKIEMRGESYRKVKAKKLDSKNLNH